MSANDIQIGTGDSSTGFSLLSIPSNPGGVLVFDESTGILKSDTGYVKNNPGTIGLTTDAGNDAIVPGIKGYIVIPYNCTITKWHIVADKVGSIVIDIWKASGTIPTALNTITGSEKPTLTSQQLNSDVNLSSWTTAISSGDIICFNVDSVEAISRITLTIGVIK